MGKEGCPTKGAPLNKNSRHKGILPVVLMELTIYSIVGKTSRSKSVPKSDTGKINGVGLENI
jgi:hypothetical protein